MAFSGQFSVGVLLVSSLKADHGTWIIQALPQWTEGQRIKFWRRLEQLVSVANLGREWTDVHIWMYGYHIIRLDYQIIIDYHRLSLFNTACRTAFHIFMMQKGHQDLSTLLWWVPERPHCVFSSQSVGWLWQVRLIDNPWLSGNDPQVGCPFLLVQSIGTYRHRERRKGYWRWFPSLGHWIWQFQVACYDMLCRFRWLSKVLWVNVRLF